MCMKMVKNKMQYRRKTGSGCPYNEVERNSTGYQGEIYEGL